MRPSTPLEFPGSRYVAGWWKQLAPLRPRALWVAHLLFHHVEALVRTSRPVEPDPLTRVLLHALRTPDTSTNLAARLCVPSAVTDRLLRQLHQDGLAQDAQDRWSLTPLGRQALTEERYVRPGYERRAFHFVQNEAAQPPCYLPTTDLPLRPWPAGEECTFDVGWLERCAAQPAEWKERRGFPRDVEGIVRNSSVPATVLPWQGVVVDRPGYIPAALVLASGEQGDRLLGFAVDPESWNLHAREAAFIVHAGWQEVFPDAASDPAPAAWREAWHGWCQRRGLPTVETEQCELAYADCRVRVRAPARLVERLRSGRSEALKGEAWLLAGSGRVRRAAQIEIVSG